MVKTVESVSLINANTKKLKVRLKAQANKKPIKTQKTVLLIWFLGAFFMSYQFILQISTSVMIEPLGESLGISDLGVSILSSAYFYTYIILQIPAGILVDKGNVRWIYALSLGCLSIMSICFALSHSFANTLIIRILMGIFGAPGLVSAFYLINRWFLKKYFALFLGLTEMYCGIASALAQIVMAQGVIYIGWRWTMGTYGIMGTAIAILGFFIIRERKAKDIMDLSFKPQRILWRQIKEPKPEAQKDKTPSLFMQHFKRLLTMPEVWVAGGISGFTFAILSGFAGFWCVPLLQTKFGFSLTHAALSSAAILIGSATGTPIMGILADKLANVERWMALGLLVAALLFLPFIFLAHIEFILAIVILLLIGLLSAIYIAPFALVRKMIPSEINSTAMGMVNMLCIVIGAPILVPIIGAIIHHMHRAGLSEVTGFQIALSLFPLLLLLGAGMSLWLAKKQKMASISGGA